MKHSKGDNTHQNRQVPGHRHKPDERDDLDSRKNEEQQDKGSDVTHNKKDVHHEQKAHDKK